NVIVWVGVEQKCGQDKPLKPNEIKLKYRLLRHIMISVHKNYLVKQNNKNFHLELTGGHSWDSISHSLQNAIEEREASS
ncbi:hypothetical protein WQ95_17830, partial [Escherichia coli]